MKKILLFILAFCSQAYASQFLSIISDVDDTIKMTALKASKNHTLRYGPGSAPFYGLSDLYTYFLCHGVPQKNVCVSARGNDETLRGMIYVTAAPPLVHRLALRFLKKNSFPSRKNLVHKPKLRLSTYEYKKKVISDIVSYYPNKPYILIGDNGEYDSKAYRDIKERFPKQIQGIFIHYVYPTNGTHHKIEDGQLPYLTVVDLAIHFLNQSFISVQDFEVLLANSLKDLNRNNTHVVRDWMSCRDFFKKNYFPEISQRYKALDSEISVFKDKLLAHHRCQ